MTRQSRQNDEEIKASTIALFEAVGGGLALWSRDCLDLSPDEAVLLSEATLKFMMDAADVKEEDVPTGTLAAQLLTPEGRGQLAKTIAQRSGVS